MKVAVIGHVEMAEFALVERVPEPGDIVHASETWELPAGGAAVAAVQIARLGGGCLFMTAIGSDSRGDLVVPGLTEMGLHVEAARRPSDQRRAFVYLDAEGERTITTIGERVGPEGDDDLPWEELEQADALYVTAADPEVLRKARSAKKLVATVRVGKALAEAGVQLDVLVASANDKGETYSPGDIEPAPHWVVRTDGSRGGSLETADGTTTMWKSFPPTGPKGDAYGAGDSFAGGITFGLGSGLPIEKAISVGAFCGSRAIRGRGPYAGQASQEEFRAWHESQPLSP